MTRAVTVLLLAALRTYKRVLSPLCAGACRFSPSCSTYAMEAVTRHGPWLGSRMALARLARCHPFSRGGHDPVPARTQR